MQESGSRTIILNFECWILNDFITYIANCIMYWRKLLDTTTFELLNFLLKTDFSIHQIFPLLSKIWYSKWPLWNFFECWMLNLEFGMTFHRTTTLNLEVFSDGWVIATKEQSYRSHSGKLEKPFIWLRFLHFAALQSKWQRSFCI